MKLYKGMITVSLILTIIAICIGNVLAEDYAVPQRTDSNVIVASYNIQFLGNNPHDLDKLAMIIENFDVCGIEEVKKESEVKLSKNSISIANYCQNIYRLQIQEYSLTILNLYIYLFSGIEF